MSLYLLLLALQADAPLDPPPLKIKPVVVTNPAPTTVVNPSITFTPAPKPAVNPTIIYTPAPKPAQAGPASEPEIEAAPPPAPAGLSEAAVKRILAERKANAERQAAHRKELAAAQDAVAKALAAVPFDLDALKVALVNRDRVTTSYREQLTAAVFAMLEEVPAAERLAVAKAVIQGETPARTATPQPVKPKPSPVGR